jgi:hypothetical protein
VQEQLLGFINEKVILPTGGHRLAKFIIGQENSPPHSPSRKRNPPKKNHRSSNFSVNKKLK